MTQLSLTVSATLGKSHNLLLSQQPCAVTVPTLQWVIVRIKGVNTCQRLDQPLTRGKYSKSVVLASGTT